jgi:hypothetical protein
MTRKPRYPPPEEAEIMKAREPLIRRRDELRQEHAEDASAIETARRNLLALEQRAEASRRDSAIPFADGGSPLDRLLEVQEALATLDHLVAHTTKDPTLPRALLRALPAGAALVTRITLGDRKVEWPRALQPRSDELETIEEEIALLDEELKARKKGEGPKRRYRMTRGAHSFFPTRNAPPRVLRAGAIVELTAWEAKSSTWRVHGLEPVEDAPA